MDIIQYLNAANVKARLHVPLTSSCLWVAPLIFFNVMCKQHHDTVNGTKNRDADGTRERGIHLTPLMNRTITV